MTFLEKQLLQLDTFPASALYRAAIGFSVPLLMSRACEVRCADWFLVIFFILVFLILRIGPVILRKAIPFSDEALSIWFSRRQIAKKYDSYQWRKLFWIGFGLVMYMLYSHHISPSWVCISSISILCGAIGAIRWRTLQRKRCLVIP
jgi:hypothetical protein